MKLTLTAPILPGRAEAWRRMCQELPASRAADFAASCRRLGLTALRSWVVPAPRGELAVVSLELARPGAALAGLATSDAPFDAWLRRQLRELIGVDLTALARMRGELVLDWQSTHGGTTMNTEAPAAVMTQMIAGSVFISRSLYVAAQLGIADLVAEEPQTSAELARACGAHAPSLQRVLRALASVGVFAEDEQGRFGLTPLAETLRSSAAGSLRALAQFYGAPWHAQLWDSLLHGVQTGETPIVQATGMSVFEYFMRHPERFALFDQAMTSFSITEAAAVVAGYDFSGVERLVDVGGGHGYLLGLILQANPSLRGVLFDLPPVVDGARQLLDRLGVLERCEVVGGDFFAAVPPGGDAYMLKNIVHDFDDEPAQAILTSCRRAMGERARLLLVQEALPPGNTPSPGKLLDMQMLLIGGRERTEAQYRALLDRSGFALQRVVPLPAPLHVIEAVPRPL